MLSINGTFASPLARTQFGFDHLLPGDYVGFFDCGVVSPDFHFTVLPVPDTLQAYWSRYCTLRRLREGHRFQNGDPILDSARTMMQEFAVLPEGFPYRREVLYEGLFIFGLYGSRHSIAIEDRDSLRTFLRSLANEPRLLPGIVLDLAGPTVCRGPSREERAEALLDFARWLGKPAVQQEAQKRADQLRTHPGQ